MTVSMRVAGVAGVEAIRAQFPALERSHQRNRVAYFDGPGGTQVPRAVVDAMADYLYHHNANTHWAYPTSAETDALIEQARVAAGDLLNAAPDEIAFGLNMTTLTFHLARALAAHQPAVVKYFGAEMIDESFESIRLAGEQGACQLRLGLPVHASL